MNDNTPTIVTVVCVAVVFLGFAVHQLGLAMGRSWEREKIYSRCLELNSALIHSDAVAKCKEVVK